MPDVEEHVQDGEVCAEALTEEGRPLAITHGTQVQMLLDSL